MLGDAASMRGAIVADSQGSRLAYRLGGILMATFGVLVVGQGVQWVWEALHPERGLLVQLAWFLGLVATVIGALFVIVGLLIAVAGAKRFWPMAGDADAEAPHRTNASTRRASAGAQW
jgi:uncharacterized membrane protein YcjF (UPF0283 family)